MATVNVPIVAAFGAAKTGQVGNVGYTVFDAAGAVKIARTTAGVVESTDAAGAATTGTYRAVAAIDTTWTFPLRVKWDVAGQAGVAAEETMGVGEAIQAASGVPASNLPADYQQRGVAVTLPANPPAGFLATASFGAAPAWYMPQSGDSFARLGAPAGASIAADIQTRSTYAGGAVASVTAPVTVAGLLPLDAGTTDASPAPSATAVSASDATLNASSGDYAGAMLRFTSGVHKGARRRIQAHAKAGPQHTFTFGGGADPLDSAWPSAPAPGDTFVIP